MPGTGMAFEHPPEAFLATNPNLAYGGNHSYFLSRPPGLEDGMALHGGGAPVMFLILVLLGICFLMTFGTSFLCLGEMS